MRVPASVFAGIFLLAGFLSIAGCPRRQVAHAPQEEKFWDHCEEVVPAKPDGFHHFLCQDVKGKRWEVLVRREGK
jgi:hypothetical protein